MFVALLAAFQLAQIGTIVENVRCVKNPDYGYALYVPSYYKPGPPWPLVIAFDPANKGHIPVELFAKAAEEYGWIVAASNNSPRGDREATAQSLREISADLFAKYTIHSKRIYLAGAAGNAPLINDFAVATPGAFAGTILAGAAFPGARVPRSVSHPIFAATALDDGDWRRLQKLDVELKSSHRVMTFAPSRDWMPPEFAAKALEWFELQAMRSGMRDRNPAVIARRFDAAVAEAQSLSGKPLWEAIRNIGQDFAELDHRATAFQESAKALFNEKTVQQDIKRERVEQQRERIAWQDFLESEGGLRHPERRPKALAELEVQLEALVKESTGGSTSSDRLIATRALNAMARRFRTGPHKDPDYAKLLEKFGIR